MRATLEGLRLAATRRHLGRISELIHEALGRLLRKEKLITAVQIDAETHAVELTGQDGRPLPAQDLSAGERQLLAVALLWGLARAAGQPLPVVIDTPLGRLDGSHREHLLERYFPYASHQVILLSTDTEIDDDAYARIAKHVGRSYRLVFDPGTQCHTRRKRILLGVSAMTLEHIRLSQTARDQLITLKRRTGIAHWNVLCRWAFCRSLAEPAPPPAAKLTLDSNVEMTWRVFAGDLGDVLWALVALPLPSRRSGARRRDTCPTVPAPSAPRHRIPGR